MEEVFHVNCIKHEGQDSIEADWTAANEPDGVPADIPKPLTWIVHKCCVDNPADRYQSVSELAADLRRYLVGEPLQAAPPSMLYRSGRMLARHPFIAAVSMFAIILVLCFAAYVQVVNVKIERELIAQCELIVATIDDVLDEIWVFVGTDAARERILINLMHRTEVLLSRQPNDLELRLVRARLLHQLAKVMLDQADFDAMEEAITEAVAIYEWLYPALTNDVEFVRLYANALVRLGDVHVLRDQRSRSNEYFQRSHSLLLAAYAIEPSHIGLRDDLCWSFDRLAYRSPMEARLPYLKEHLRIAGALVADSPTRVLSIFALQNAHFRLGEHWRRSSELQNRQRAADHLQKAFVLGAELVALQPGRVAFEANYIISGTYRMALLREDEGEAEAMLAANDLSQTIAEIANRAGNNWATQIAVLDAHVELARTYQHFGECEMAAAHAGRALSICQNSAILNVPKAQPRINNALRTLRRLQLLEDDSSFIKLH